MHNDQILGVLPDIIGRSLASYLESQKLTPSNHTVDKNLALYLDQLIDISRLDGCINKVGNTLHRIPWTFDKFDHSPKLRIKLRGKKGK